MVTADPAEAQQLAAAAQPVVLILPPGAPAPEGRDRPGCIAVLVGDPTDPAVRAAAEEMAAELFGRAP